MVEGQNLGVEVADGHIINCSVTGKIKLQMTDDNGNVLEVVLHNVMYIPRLSHHLFSITHFAKHGHFATIRNGSTTLYFGQQKSPVTFTNDRSQPMAVDVMVILTAEQPHLFLANHNHDHSANKRRTGLEVLHQCIGHRKCQALPASSEHGVWADTMIRMRPEQECISCELSMARASSRKKEAHTGSSYAGEYIFLDILRPAVPVGLTQGTTFLFYLILVDVYSHYACIYGIKDKSSACVIETLTGYQADHGHIGNYEYLDIARICADSGNQFMSQEFKGHCWKKGINLNLMFHALVYSCYIFNVLPVKG